jgi:hypothetical protein
MQDRRPIFVLVALVLVIGVGFGVRSMGSPKASTSSNSAAPVAPTTATSGPTDLKDAWHPAIDHINNVENALFRNPDPSGVDGIMEPSCSCYAETKKRLTDLKQKGWHVAGDNLVITSSNVTKVDSPDQVEVFVQVSVPGFGVVDNTGKTVEDGGQPITGSLLYILHRGSDNLWRLTDRHSA